MKYLCLVYSEEAKLQGFPDEECVAFDEGLRGTRACLASEALQPVHTATTVRVRNGVVSTTVVAGDCTFADLKLPYAAVATDLLTGEPVVLRQGRLAPAVRASASVPGIVAPVELDGRLLVDGGPGNNLPISVARSLGADVVVAVGLSNPPRRVPRDPVNTLVAALDVLLLRAGDPPATADVYLPIPAEGLGSLLRLSRTAELAQMGREAAEKALPAIREVLARGPASLSGHGRPV